jgi:hypothetical protein
MPWFWQTSYSFGVKKQGWLQAIQERFRMEQAGSGYLDGIS